MSLDSMISESGLNENFRLELILLFVGLDCLRKLKQIVGFICGRRKNGSLLVKSVNPNIIYIKYIYIKI